MKKVKMELFQCSCCKRHVSLEEDTLIEQTGCPYYSCPSNERNAPDPDLILILTFEVEVEESAG